MLDWTELVKLTVALIAVIDIPGNVPMFLQQTGRMTGRDRRITALVAGVATAVILIVFANAGEAILGAFGISIDAFRVLGGIVILLIALDMLGLMGAGGGSMSTEEDPNPIVTGVFPMAVPLFAGPGSITAVMIYAHTTDKHPHQDLVISGIVLAVSVLIVIGLLMASMLSHLITPVAQSVLNRLLGMIVGALGVEFILEGLAGFFLLVTIVP
ncbi:MAG: MarC family protein [Pseudomonadota bacterium]